MDPDRDATAWFEALFEAHYGDLVRYATRRVGADAASDIVSSTFLVAWRRRDDVPQDEPRPWLYAIARKVIGNELRARRRRERLDGRARQQPDAVATTAPDHAGPVAERLRVHQALAALSPRDQEVLRLTEWEGLDLAGAATVLECTRTAAKVRLHRARRRFAVQLAALDGADAIDASDATVHSAAPPAAIFEGNPTS
jgi:RNA polymerase sigma-70 factor (ECF subfamily)